ncbi:hypothetical protein [Pseudomonas sp. TH31]|uniref:hypothetical protein n=1 Tax=Pseudomonas sp. TH31 TaxID=2796396 RepID=UPI0019147DC1|nr:hypothetical protein [Pseudomonas sp. TH31]MBK5414026.1 hypothetical protein [Pseudomonas sp. TH31]
MNLKGKYEVIHCSLPMTFTQALLVFPVQLRIHSTANCHLLAASAQGRIIVDARLFFSLPQSCDHQVVILRTINTVAFVVVKTEVQTSLAPVSGQKQVVARRENTQLKSHYIASIRAYNATPSR